MRMAELAKELLGRERIAIVPHVSPDGDALGSALAARRALIRLGKRAAVVSQDAVPGMYAFVPDIDTVVKPKHLAFEPDCMLLVDVASADRAGAELALPSGAVRLLIDHHATNGGFDGLCVIREHASSTGELVLELLDELGVALDTETAVQLYVAIATDTGNFSYSYTTPEAFRAAARCIEAGLPIDECSRRLFRLRSVPRTKLIGAGLSRMRTAQDGRIAYILLTRDVFEACGAGHEDTEGLINYLNEMEGVEACFLAEERTGSVKVSLRSNGRLDVSRIAQSMGGGGHECAAGATLPLPLEAAAHTLLDALALALGSV